MQDKWEQCKVIRIWPEIIEKMKEDFAITDRTFHAFLEPLTISSVENDIIRICCPGGVFAIEFFQKMYYLPIKVTVEEILERPYEIEFICEEEEKTALEDKIEPTSSLDQNCTFDTFVVDDQNRMAYKAAVSVADAEEPVYNPLFLYGGTELGKTHLLHAIGHRILERKPDSHILYVTSEEYANELIECVRTGNSVLMAEIRDKYRNVDVLMMDDIQFLMGKTTCLKELFHTMDTLLRNRKAVVFTADRLPGKLELEDRLYYALQSGLVVGVSVPEDSYTVMSILQQKKENTQPKTVRSGIWCETDLKKTDPSCAQSGLNSRFTFDTFVVGDRNRMAYAAAVTVAESAEPVYNPLFIYGTTGLGKTHLLHAIGQRILEQRPDSNIRYVTSEEFVNKQIDSIRIGSSASMNWFRNKYRDADVLMVDDVQYFIGKEASLEELFYTMDTLQRRHKTVVFTADRLPVELELEERFFYTLESGLVVGLSAPDHDTAVSILRKKVENDPFEVADEVLGYIASQFWINVYEMEGALKKLRLLYDVNHQKITMDIAIRELQV